jgi:ferredoxin
MDRDARLDTTAVTRYLAKADFQKLLDQLVALGYEVVGPTVDQGAIIYDRIRTPEDLPQGWTDEQEAGRYRLVRRDDDAWFGFVVGPHSWKKYFFPPSATVSRADRTDSGWQFTDSPQTPVRLALLGVRACEIAALQVQDRIFMGDAYQDPIYAARRRPALIIAVNCTQAAPTCFCTSMQTGPRCTAGFDVALTELPAGFTVEIGSEAGRELTELLPLRTAAEDEMTAADAARRQAVEQITRRLNTEGIRDLLLSNLEHPHWNEVAGRCLSCANCTMVCPTCFCSSVDEVADLAGDHVERRRRWDSCFNLDFSYINGGILRNQIRSRYRQWLTHKLASWIDQFGTSGCVGCGRCITWCPVAIDLTAEVPKLREAAT